MRQLYLPHIFFIIFGLLNYTAVWAACAADGSITGSNGPLILGSGGCATASGGTASIEVGASVANPAGDALTAATTAWNITNNGLIDASGSGISIQNGGSIINSLGASITSSGGNAIVSAGGGVPQITLENFGTIQVVNGDSAALLVGGATVINHAGALIEGDFDGLSISANGSSPSGGLSVVDNAGSIISNGGFNDGVLLGLGVVLLIVRVGLLLVSCL